VWYEDSIDRSFTEPPVPNPYAHESDKMNSIQIHCTNCGALVSAEDINIKAMVGKCNDCDHVFSITPPSSYPPIDGVGGEGQYSSSPPARPKNITKEIGPGGELYLKKHWFNTKLFFLLFFCIAWDAFLIFWYSTALIQPGTPWVMIIFPIGHVAVGVGLTYYVICGFLNTTHIFADELSVIVNHRPLPWLGNREINAKDVRRLMIQLSRSYNQNQRMYETFDVLADVDGEEAKLLTGLEESESRFISVSDSSSMTFQFIKLDAEFGNFQLRERQNQNLMFGGGDDPRR